MRRAVLGATLLFAGTLLAVCRPHHANPEEVSTWQTAGLAFNVPDRWIKEPVASPARVAQWQVPLSRGQTGDPVEIVVFFFGPRVGGGAKENIEAWAGTLTGSDGHAPIPSPETREIAGHKITQVLLSGTYAQANAGPGRPPTLKTAYSLLGAVVENSDGNLYWRVTGPEAEVAVMEPILTRVIDSLKARNAKP